EAAAGARPGRGWQPGERAGPSGGGWQPGERTGPSGWTRPAGPDTPGGPAIELRPGIPWTAGIDRAAWRRAWRAAGAAAPTARTQPQGSAALRRALTVYPRRSPAVHRPPGRAKRARVAHARRG